MDYFKLKIIKTQKIQEKALTFSFKLPEDSR